MTHCGETVRLDKFIADNTDYSRSDVKTLIKQKRVALSSGAGAKANLKINASDIISIDQNIIDAIGIRTFLLHKPQGTICSSIDEVYPSVLNLLNEPKKSSLKIVGRLDQDTTGALLITDDGQLVHHINSPKTGCQKSYIATLDTDITESMIQALQSGVMLKGDDKPTLPAKVEVLTQQQVKLTITEGRYHQVKRMFAAVGNHVRQLHRSAISSIDLQSLELGQYRQLSTQEVERLRQLKSKADSC
jgi:16S rRNA pseudouridine516 synthase